MNCRPGQIARIVRSNAGNENRMVAVVRAPAPGDELLPLADPFITPAWVVKPLQPLRSIARNGAVSHAMEAVIFPDAWLLPVGDQDECAALREADPIDVASIAWG